jgi:hypothetical protein
LFKDRIKIFLKHSRFHVLSEESPLKGENKPSPRKSSDIGNRRSM